jgi:hypothetical protein
VETGTPYVLFKDHCNRKSNQKNLGTIKSSNLCTEIIEYTSKDEARRPPSLSIAGPPPADLTMWVSLTGGRVQPGVGEPGGLR